MRTYASILALVLITASTTLAGDKSVRYFSDAERYQHVNPVVLERDYISSLHSMNDGVVESALAHATMMKLVLPSRSNRALYERVIDIAKTATSPELRYKAFLSGMVLSNPEMFINTNIREFNSPDELFAALASRLSEYYAAR